MWSAPRRAISTASLLLIISAAPATAQQRLAFIDGTYTMSAEACSKLKVLAGGAARNLNTVPWSLDAKGFHSWEGGCTARKLIPRATGQEWSVTMTCHEAADASVESYVIRRTSPSILSVSLTTPKAKSADRKPVTYKRCDVRTGTWR